MSAVTLSAVTVACLLGQTRPGQPIVSPKAIITRAIEAQGGEDKLARARTYTYRLKGKGIVENAEFAGEIYMQLPDRFKWFLDINVQGNHVLYTRVYDGKAVWDLVSGERTQAKDDELAEARESHYVNEVASLVPLLKEKSGYSVESLGESKVQDQTAIGLKVAAAGHPDVKLFFSKGTGLLIGTEHRRKQSAGGQEVLIQEFMSDYRDVQPAAAEEKVVRNAKLSTDDATLLEYLRTHTMTDKQRKEIADHLRDLGNADFETRENASAALVALDVKAVPMLTKKTRDSDSEVAGRAKDCLKRIGKTVDGTVPRAVVRLLAARHPAGAAEVLLAYLPSAPDEATEAEIRAALTMVASRDGKPERVLVDALTDKDPIRKAAAAAALGRDGGNAKAQAGLQIYLPGLKWPRKSVYFRDGKKIMEVEREEMKFYTRFPESVFAKP